MLNSGKSRFRATNCQLRWEKSAAMNWDTTSRFHSTPPDDVGEADEGEPPLPEPPTVEKKWSNRATPGSDHSGHVVTRRDGEPRKVPIF